MILGAVMSLGVTIADADNIPGLYNTGVDDSGILIAPTIGGTPDPHYQILETGNNAVLIWSLNGTWLENGPDSRWLWQNPDATPGNVVRTFRLTFDLSGLDPSTAAISGRWSSDNNGLDILVNGNSTGQTTPVEAFRNWHSFNIPNQYLVAGANQIDFKVDEIGAPGAFRAEFLHGTADPIFTGVPDPASSVGLMSLGLASLGLVRRLGRKA